MTSIFVFGSNLAGRHGKGAALDALKKHGAIYGIGCGLQLQIYTYRWNRCGRKGQRCIVTARGTMNSCRLEFEDGFKMITSRNSIAKWRHGGRHGAWPPWGSVRTVDRVPEGARYVCGDRGWCYYISRREIIAALPAEWKHIT